MEFKIKHDTKWIHYGIAVPWIVLIAAFVISMIFFGYDMSNESKAILFLNILVCCAPFEILSILLFAAEKIYGARIIIRQDHVEIRMVLRHKRISFDEIETAKYSHYYTRKKDAPSLLATPDYNITLEPELRSQLIFYLNSGKIFRLNDKAAGYEERQKRAQVDMKFNPDETIRLYQAYQCYRSAADQYAREHGLQIPR